MKKFLLFFVMIVVALFFTVQIIFSTILGSVMGVPVHVTSIKFGISGAGIYGLEIGNPKGFREKQLASIPEISVQYDLGAFFKGKVHLQRIHIAIDEVTIERNKAGEFNLMEMKTMKKPKQQEQKPSAPTTQTGKAAPLPPLQIDEVVLDVNKARFVVGGSAKEFSLNIKNQTFHNVTYAPTLIREIVFFILKTVGMSAFPDNLDALFKGVGGEVGTTVGKWMNKLSSASFKLK